MKYRKGLLQPQYVKINELIKNLKRLSNFRLIVIYSKSSCVNA